MPAAAGVQPLPRTPGPEAPALAGVTGNRDLGLAGPRVTESDSDRGN